MWASDESEIDMNDLWRYDVEVDDLISSGYPDAPAGCQVSECLEISYLGIEYLNCKAKRKVVCSFPTTSGALIQ